MLGLSKMISKKGRYVASSDQTIVGFDGVICASRSGLSTLKTPLTPLDAIEQRHSVRQYDERPLHSLPPELCRRAPGHAHVPED